MHHPRLALVLCLLALLTPHPLAAEDGYELWLRYRPIPDAQRLQAYRGAISQIAIDDGTPTLRAAAEELSTGLRGLLGVEVPRVSRASRDGAVIVGTTRSPNIAALPLAAELRAAGREGFVIRSMPVGGRQAIVVAANEDIGALYGAFHLLRLLQTHQDIGSLAITSAPRMGYRLLNHWDNLNGSVERGYAGSSLWNWQELPGRIDPRMRDYARANASLGINGTVINNVNANATILTPEYLPKVAALANTFRPFGIRVFLSARFSAPMEIGGLKTADPLDPAVQQWWKTKAAEIYRHIPDFGGFLVKANSEGQPGPQDYGRSHADGANMLADAVAPHGGIVMWRAFVYSNELPVDRIKQAYDEFKPLDGQFRDNVMVQVKNGPLDFQPREPFHPLFGAMPRTPLMMEFQVTQEYLGHHIDLVYLAPLFEEVLDAETYANGPGSTVTRVIDGSLHGHSLTGIAGVANTGSDRNWTGHHFHQANWYAYGRLAWDPSLSSEQIADEWLRMTFTSDPTFVGPVKRMMMSSRETAVNYSAPLGLHHQMGEHHHYGPAPWVSGGGRADWTSVYYHRADTLAIGFDRTATGSNAVGQYFAPVRDRWSSRETVPDSLLLWFHRVGWNERMRSGRTLWEELVHRYNEGVDSVRSMQRTWDSVRGKIDDERWAAVRDKLVQQEKAARWWRDASLLYWQQFSRQPIPAGYEQPTRTLDFFRSIRSATIPDV